MRLFKAGFSILGLPTNDEEDIMGNIGWRIAASTAAVTAALAASTGVAAAAPSGDSYTLQCGTTTYQVVKPDENAARHNQTRCSALSTASVPFRSSSPPPTERGNRAKSGRLDRSCAEGGD
jgi:hypothetical protein